MLLWGSCFTDNKITGKKPAREFVFRVEINSSSNNEKCEIFRHKMHDIQ